MKIVDVCAFYTPHGGGVRTYVEQKLLAGPRFGHEIVILAPGDSYAVHHRGPHSRIVTLPSPRFPLDRKYWYFDDEQALHRTLDAEAPDFVEVSSPWRSPLMVARWCSGGPSSLIMHADPLSAYAYRWLQPAFSQSTIDRRASLYWDHLRELGRRFGRVVCANRDLSRRLTEGGVANVVTHAMGVEPDRFSPAHRDARLRARLLAQCGLPESAHLLIGVGRLAPEKRWPMIVDAVTAASQHAPIGLILFGEGRERGAILRRMGGNPHLRLFEPERDRQKFASILASADALIHGCEAETFCMAAAEARASAVPVIVPDCGGAADHAGGGAGLTYKAGSSFAAADAIIRFTNLSASEGWPQRVRTIDDHFRALFEDYETLRKGEHHAA